MRNFSLKKNERLRSKNDIDKLFTSGESFVIYPFRIVYKFSDSNSSSKASILISIPKKRFKRAVKRNLLRRRTREAYRLNKDTLLHNLPNNHTLYISNELHDYSVIEKKMKELLVRLNKEINLTDTDTKTDKI